MERKLICLINENNMKSIKFGKTSIKIRRSTRPYSADEAQKRV